MNETAIVPTRVELDTLEDLGNMMLTSGYFDGVGKVAQAAVKVLAGREVGLGPVASMRLLHIVDGKIEMSADLLAMRVKEHPRYDYRVREITAEACVIVFFEDGEPCGISEFTMGDAENAGLGRKETWKRYPRNMLFNRALTNGVAWFCPDVAAGGSFVVEGAITTDPATGEIVEASDSLEPVADASERPNHIAGGRVGGGGDTNRPDVGAVTPPSREESPTDEALAYGEGASDESDVGDSSRHVAATPTPSASTESGALPPGTDGASVSVGEPPERAEESSTSAYAEGERTLEAAGPRVEPPPSAIRALSSQTNQLLRHAHAMRWNDQAIDAEVAAAYPGVVNLSDLTQEQARELITVWGQYVRDSRMTKDQQDALKPLCTIRDAKAAAETLFGFKVSSLGELTQTEGEMLIRKIGEIRAEQVRAGV